MADEVKWGRIREWNGSLGCPPVAVGKPCAHKDRQFGWFCLDGSLTGDAVFWEHYTTAYRIPVEFDHLDDDGLDMKRWSDVFKPVVDGIGPEGVSVKTHEVEYTNDGFHWFKPVSYAKWNTNCGYRYRPLQTPDLEGNPADPFAGYSSAELRAAADAKDAADDPLKPWADLFDATYHAWASTSSRDEEDNKAAARVLRDGAAKLLGVTL